MGTHYLWVHMTHQLGSGTFAADANASSWSFCSCSAIAAAALAEGERSSGLRSCRSAVSDAVRSSSSFRQTWMSSCRAETVLTSDVTYIHPGKEGYQAIARCSQAGYLQAGVGHMPGTESLNLLSPAQRECNCTSASAILPSAHGTR